MSRPCASQAVASTRTLRRLRTPQSLRLSMVSGAGPSVGRQSSPRWVAFIHLLTLPDKEPACATGLWSTEGKIGPLTRRAKSKGRVGNDIAHPPADGHTALELQRMISRLRRRA